MRAVLLGVACALLLSLALTPLCRRLALRVRAVDHPSARKFSRALSVPRLGGLAIAAAFYGTVLLLWLGKSVVVTATLQPGTHVVPILVGGLPILALGVVDDLRGLRALPKLAVEVAVAVFLYSQGLRIGYPGAGLGTASQVVSALLTVGWIVGVVNAVNLVDGLDGLASGVAAIALFTMTAAALVRGELLLAFLTGTLAGAVLGFLRYNFNPASIFMGDTGSLFLGYVLSATAIWSVRKSATLVLVVFPVVSLGLPLLDTGLTVFRRVLAGRPVLQADRDHVHHRLLLRGLPVPTAVLLLYGVCLAFSGLSLLMVLGPPWVARLAFVLAGGLTVLLSYFLGYLRGGPEGLWAALKRRRKTQALLRRLLWLQQALEKAETVPQVEALLGDFGEALGMPLALKIGGAGDYPILTPEQAAQPIGALVLPQHQPENPEERTLLYLLCDTLGPALARLTGPKTKPNKPVSESG